MADTTSITQLPAPQANITIQQETNQQLPSQEQQNELINSLNRAAVDGSTQLPSRDIPMETGPITSDPKVRVNYLPEKEIDYIGEYTSEDDIVRNQKTSSLRNSLFDKVFDELQVSIILTILYFIFQLPLTNSTILKFVPKLFNDSGNLKTSGIIFKSSLFGISYFLVTKLSDHFLKGR